MMIAPQSAGEISVEELTDRAAFAALDWSGLQPRGPFFDAAWFAIWASSLARPPRALKLLIAHRDGRLVGALPLINEKRRLAGAPARVLRSLSDDHSQRFDLLLDPAYADEAAHALWGHLCRDGSWDALELREVPVENANADRLIAYARDNGNPVASWPAQKSPYLVLGDLDQILDAKFRSNLRRRRKKLTNEVGPVELEWIDGRDREQLNRALDDGLRLEAAGWKGARGTAIACDPQLSSRYRAVAHTFAARGKLRLAFLRAGEKRVAFHFALLDDGVYSLFKPGFDPELSGYGLGHLLIESVARDLFAGGARELDFLGDEAAWKSEWTTTTRPHAWRYVFAPTPRGRALATWKFSLVPALRGLAARFRR